MNILYSTRTSLILSPRNRILYLPKAKTRYVLDFYPSPTLPTYLRSTYLPYLTYLCTLLPYLPTYLPYLPYLPTLPTYPTYLTLPTYLPYLPTYLPYLPTYLPT